MKSIYRSEAARRAVLELYDAQMAQLGRPYRDLWVDTCFGRTHLIETGDPSARPLLLFHGGNATTAYNLKYCGFLLESFHVYAVDTIGHPGKSAEVCLSPRGEDYGRWGSEVITALGYDKMACFGGSFGAGVLVKTMCVAPEKVERSALTVPSAIRNAPAYRSMNMLLPMLLYWATRREKWFIRCILPMAIEEPAISPDILATARCSIDNAKIKTGMPADEPLERLERYKNPVLVMAAERDCLFPGEQVLARAGQAWKQAETYLLRGRGHIHAMTEADQARIRDFLLR